MMHEREKSDTAVVAVKPTNKAGATAADPVEPRAGTKRNASEQSTHRTLSRVRVTQALDRVRQAARQGKREKFTALLHHLSIDLFREAFLALKRDAAPGVDELTWRAYAADLERNLTDLHARIQKWLKAGVLEDGVVTVSDKGTGQGSVISSVGARVRASSSSRGNPGAIACGRGSRTSRRSCGGAGTSRSPSRGNGWRRSSGATLPTTPCQPTRRRSGLSVTT